MFTWFELIFYKNKHDLSHRRRNNIFDTQKNTYSKIKKCFMFYTRIPLSNKYNNLIYFLKYRENIFARETIKYIKAYYIPIIV